MKKVVTRASLIPTGMVILFALACVGQPLRPKVTPEDTRPAAKSKRLRAIVERLTTDYSIPGLSVAIAEDGEETLVATAGFADIDGRIPVSADTKFFIGSISKNLFATIALRLVDRGQLQLDDPLSNYFEWPRGDEVKIRMLLDHTSGIPDYLTADSFQRAEDGGIPDFFRIVRTPTELIETIPDRTPIFDPGTRQEYSNTNGLLVGEVIRKVTGKPLATAFDELLAQPVGLQEMYLYGTSTEQRDRARGYTGSETWGATAGNLIDCSSADEALPDSADGSVVASARSLLRYHQALRHGELLSDLSWTAMRTVRAPFDNGLAYLIGSGRFGAYEGNIGKAMGHVVANVYYPDHRTFVVMMSSRSDVALPLAPLLQEWFATKQK